MEWKRQSLLVAVAACLGGWQNLASQGVPGDKQPMAEQVFTNVQVLKGIPVSEFMATMGFFAASVGLNCVYCHVPESLQDWKKFAEDVPRKRIARNMIAMVNTINKTNFGGRAVITCYSCHHGNERPKPIPSLAQQYGTPEEDPNEIEVPPQAVAGPSAEQLLDKFVAARAPRARHTLRDPRHIRRLRNLSPAGAFRVVGEGPGARWRASFTPRMATARLCTTAEGWVASPIIR